MQIKDLRVASLELDYLDIFWSVESDEDLLNYKCTIQRSESPGGPWDNIAEVPLDLEWYGDNTIPKRG